MELTKIALRIFRRCLQWLFCGLIWGALCGAAIGAAFAAALHFAKWGAILGIAEGGVVGTLSFAIAGLRCVWRADSQTELEIDRACRSSLKASLLLSVAGAFSFPLATMLWQWATSPLRSDWGNAALVGYAYGSQAGFCLGLMVGAVAPDWFGRLREIVRQITPPPKHLK